MDTLVADDICRWVTKVVFEQLTTIFSGSRDQNNATTGTAGATAPILFDQILFPLHMTEAYVGGSAGVFTNPVARVGSSPNADTPSDHIPVFADFMLASDDGLPPPATSTIHITALMVNPNGSDQGQEWIMLKNSRSSETSLAGWRLRDQSNNELQLSGSIPANGQLTIDDPQGKLPLNNNGDAIVLVNPQYQIIRRATYSRSQVSNRHRSLAITNARVCLQAPALLGPCPPIANPTKPLAGCDVSNVS